ncbi:hypothetical protein RCG23_20225 [Neobacillus sp. PS3-34]|nr:hypothetical protein [Neobacillus sp. PS3-34]WML47670.1 hypothetical protein RCG23_20225 [Neobacillus sp. PS3-34]
MKNRYNELIKELTDRELLFHLYATQILLLTISFILGIILYDHFSFINNIKWQDPSVIWAGAGSGVAVVMVDIILMKLLPPPITMMAG